MHSRHILSHRLPCPDGRCLSGRHTVSLCLRRAGHTQTRGGTQCAGRRALQHPDLGPSSTLVLLFVLLCSVFCLAPVFPTPPNAVLLPQRAREKDREREKDRQRDMERERARYIKADLEGHDSDDDREPWQRRSLRHS